MRKFFPVVVLALFVYALSGCGGAESTAKPAESTSKPAANTSTPTQSTSKPAESTAVPTKTTSSATWKIAIEGVGQATEFTSLDLQKTGTVTIKAAVKDKDTSGPEEQWTGVPLAKVLKNLGVNQYTTVKVESADGTAKEYTPDLVDSEGTILGTEVGGKALDRDKGPVQLVVNGKGSNWWIKQVVKITVIK